MKIENQNNESSLTETVHLLGNRSNYDHLMKSIQQHKAGQAKAHGLIQVEEETQERTSFISAAHNIHASNF